MALGNALRALRSRNYRLFFAGQSVSLIGTWIQRIATPWLVYQLTDSVFLLGLVGFVGQIPIFLLAPFAGVFSDRWNRYRILLATQVLAMVQATVMAWLVLSGRIEIWQILVLSLLLGAVNAFDIPARQSFLAICQRFRRCTEFTPCRRRVSAGLPDSTVMFSVGSASFRALAIAASIASSPALPNP